MSTRGRRDFHRLGAGAVTAVAGGPAFGPRYAAEASRKPSVHRIRGAPGHTSQRKPTTRIVRRAIFRSPSALGWTTTGLLVKSTGSTQRTPIGWQAS